MESPRFCTTGLTAAWILASMLGRASIGDAQPATTVQLPTFGVSVDAAGVLRREAFEDPTGQLHRDRVAAARAAQPAELFRAAPLRKVSLTRLAAAIEKKLAAGDKPDDAMRYLAGLQRAQCVFFYPDLKDIVIAGPAEGWIEDLSGRVRGVGTGRPVLELQDLAVALRVYAPKGKPPGMVGCSIDPSAEGLARMQEFQRKIPKVVREDERAQVAQFVAQGLHDSLGMARIRVFGVPADTHFAQVLVEADYRMKLIGMGMEKPPIDLPSYLELMGSSSGGGGTLQRWWFVPHYDCVKLSEDRLALELVGQGVKLLAEDKLVEAGGKLGAGQKANQASDLFSQAFTRKYPDLSAKSPVYAQMRNLIDLSVLAAFIQQEKFAERIGWDLGVLGNEAKLPVCGRPNAQQVEAAAMAVWKGSRLLAPAGGGVQFQAEQAILKDRLLPDKDGKLRDERDKVRMPAGDAWWWD